MLSLKIITASTRPGRKGPSIANWIHEKSLSQKGFDVELLDLKEINLPFLDEPEHPRLKKYQHEHTKKWSATIDSADAFIMVTPEYNYAMPATLKNAIDFLFTEWSNKPVAFVSYGGVSGGIRAVQMLKQVVTTLKMIPLMESIAIHSFPKHIDDKGIFTGGEALDKSAEVMLREMEKWADTMRTFRAK